MDAVAEYEHWFEPLGLQPHEAAEIIPLRPILLGYRGSVAHGMYVAPDTPTGIDDVDLMGVYIPPLLFYFGSGYAAGPDVVEKMVAERFDCVSYELRKFIGLLEKCNPNVLSLLWLDPASYLIQSAEGRMLVENRKLFASKAAYHSFSGYAYSQLKRMTNWHSKESLCSCVGDFHEQDCPLREQRGRGSAKRYATGFMGAKRKALVEKFGYDTKNAAHLIRLLNMGIEFLSTGELVVDRRKAGDADRLLSIKRGDMSLEAVQEWADALFEEMKRVNAASALPPTPDRAAIANLTMDTLCLAHAGTATLWNTARMTRHLAATYKPAHDWP